MVKPSITFSESRLLPALIVSFLGLAAMLILISDVSNWTRLLVIVGFALVIIWPMRRLFYPRWVIQITENSLRYHNVGSKQTIEIETSRIITACIQTTTMLGSGADGGVGIQNELVLKTDDKVWTLPLPFLSVKRKQPEKVLFEKFPTK